MCMPIFLLFFLFCRTLTKLPDTDGHSLQASSGSPLHATVLCAEVCVCVCVCVFVCLFVCLFQITFYLWMNKCEIATVTLRHDRLLIL